MRKTTRETNQILQDMVSGDTHRVWEASCDIISLGQERESILPFVPHLSEIVDRTKDLAMGGLIASNQRFLKLAVKTIEFHKTSTECPCCLYEAGGDDQIFNPVEEQKQGHITVTKIVKIDPDAVDQSSDPRYDPSYDYNIDYYLAECARCGQKYKVIQREYHYFWWGWSRIFS